VESRLMEVAAGFDVLLGIETTAGKAGGDAFGKTVAEGHVADADAAVRNTAVVVADIGCEGDGALAEAKQVMELMKDDGVIIGRGGLYGNVLRLQPPMIVTKDDCAQLIASMKKAVEAVSKQAAAV